jgi:SAM-dependent methyltransferase
MNDAHLEVLASPEWARMLESDLLPWLVKAADLGDDVLEIGPGPGLTTELLRNLTSRLTAIEIDARLAADLAERMHGTNVEVVLGDAAATDLASDRFSAVTCFGMLHHVPSPELQDRVFAEVHRVLRESGSFVGTDSVDSESIRRFHDDDVFVPMDPDQLVHRLERIGFTEVGIEPGDYEFRFIARKPEHDTAG